MRALLLADLQDDFMPGGSLLVSCDAATVPVASAMLERGDLGRVFQKGCVTRVDSYSGSHDSGPPGLAQRRSTGAGK